MCMRFENLTPEKVDEKIISFQQHNRNLKGHNLYYAITVNEDGTIADEAYGANLMTNRGFMMTYNGTSTSVNNWYDYRFMIGTGYTTDNGLTYTGAPAFTDQAMEEYAGLCSDWTYSSFAVVKTDYDNLGTTDNGIIYQVNRIGRGYFDYQHNLPTNDNPTIAGHYGGPPTGRTVNGKTVVDTRWQEDEIGYYFNITEMGGTYDSSRDLMYRYNNNIRYYYIKDGGNTSLWKDRNLVWHFLLCDYQGNPQPLKKRYNQKLFIYVYHTLVLPEKLILDNWKNKQYLMINPEGYNRGYISDSIYISPISNESNYVAWQNNSTITNRNYSNNSNNVRGTISDTYYYNCIDSRSDGEPWDTQPYGTDDGVSMTYKCTINARLIEDKWAFVSRYLMGGIYWYNGNPYNTEYNTLDAQEFLVTYDELDEPDEITSEIYCNNSQEDYITYQFGVNTDTSAKRGMLPLVNMETIPTHAYLYNYDTKECDIPVKLSIPNHFYAQYRLFERLILNWIVCPDGERRRCYAYFNPYAYKENDSDYNGFKPGNIITRIDKTAITLFAADKYWDSSTWVQFININDMGSQTDANGHLLVQKKYFIAYDNGKYADRILGLTLRDEDYPKIVPGTENVDLVTIPGSYLNLTEMIGNDENQYFTIGPHCVVKLTGEPGTGQNNTLECSECYTLPHLYLESMLHARQAYGKHILYKLWYNYGCLNMLDVTEESTLQSIDGVRKTLKCHFATNKYFSNSMEDHNNGRYMILSGVAGNDSILGDTPYSITIFDNDLDVESLYPTSEQSILSICSRRYSTRYSSNSNTHWYMLDDEYLEVSPDDVIMSGISGKRATSYDYNGYFFGGVYDENKELLYTISPRRTPLWIRHPDAKYVNLGFSLDQYILNDDYGIYDNPRDIWFIKNKNYGLDMPCIENARHGICIKGSSNLMAYNDVSEGNIYLKTWHIIDMSDPLDANGEPKILQTFEIDENFIGGTFTGGIGFSHYVYLRMNDKSNNYSIWLYDTTSQNLTHLADQAWNGFDDRTGDRDCCFVGNDDILCYCGAINNNSITNHGYNYGSAIYCISAEDPETLYTLYNQQNTMSSLQLKTVNWGTLENPKNQLLLAAYGRYGSGYSYTRQRIVLDVGKWLKTRSWPNGVPGTYWNSRSNNSTNGNYNDAFIYAYIYKKGVIEFKDGDTSAKTTLLSYRPLENFLPMEFTCTTKTINAFNNPIQISGKTYTFTRTNNMKLINPLLNNETESNIWKQNTES